MNQEEAKRKARAKQRHETYIKNKEIKTNAKRRAAEARKLEQAAASQQRSRQRRTEQTQTAWYVLRFWFFRCAAKFTHALPFQGETLWNTTPGTH